MKKFALTALVAVTLIAPMIVAPLAAQAGEVYNREHWQQDRIYNGVRNGSVTQREYNNLEGREARLNDQRANDLAHHDGHLTGAEYRQLNREESRDSRAIYRDKHNQWNQN